MAEAELRLDKKMLLGLSNIVLYSIEKGISRGCAEDISQPRQASRSPH
jgi:hypothetical protein